MSSKRKLLGCIALIFMTLSVQSQIVNRDFHKLWDPNVPLSWADFKGKPDSLLLRGQGFSDAGIHTMIIVDFCCQDEGKNEICFHPAIHKTKSWSLSRSETLLVHEQLHFDITELITRKIRKAISLKPEASVEEKYKTYRRLARQFSKMQIKYDKETLHGMKYKKQQKWKARVWEELEELKDFAKNPDCR